MKNYELYFYAVEPTHVGAGGYRLGRVDNTIIRDAGTGLPKLPGSSISGALRSAAIFSLPDAVDREAARNYAKADKPVGGAEDPVAQYFGFAEGHENGQSRIGALGFSDAQILLFPVYTQSGPKWITTYQRLLEAGVENPPKPGDLDKVYANSAHERLNLGWMLFQIEKAEILLPSALKEANFSKVFEDDIVVVHEGIFANLVNANLEVRTSVALDFETGSAKDGALFTYEAMPRGTVYASRIFLDNDRYPKLEEGAKALLDASLGQASELGFGAMTTRGFGRMSYHLKEVSND